MTTASRARSAPTASDIARQYNELPLWSAPFGQLILDHVPMRRGQAVLDLAAGTGFLSLELAQRCGTDSTVIAVDPWSEALEVLRSRAAYLGLTNIATMACDAETLSLPAESIDVVVCNLGLNHFRDVSTVLKICHSVLRPGGRLVLSTNLAGHMSEFYIVLRRVLDALALSSTELDSHLSHRFTVEDAQTALSLSGFTEIATHQASTCLRYADGTSFLGHSFIQLGFRPAWEALVPTPRQAAVFATLEAALNRESDADGELRLSVPMACLSATKQPRTPPTPWPLSWGQDDMQEDNQ